MQAVLKSSYTERVENYRHFDAYLRNIDRSGQFYFPVLREIYKCLQKRTER